MESWGYEGKSLLFSDDMELPIEAISSRSRNLLSGWDVPDHRHEVENVNLMELGFFELMKKTPSVNPNMGIVTAAAEIGNTSSSSHQICRGDEHGCGGGQSFSSSLMEPLGQDSSLIDLKLGRLVDFSEGRCSNRHYQKDGGGIFSSVSSASFTTKRGRSTNSGSCGSISQAPLCQVHGCNTDLACAKDYHKRHRVCALHSKTAKVVVNGIEQRFCQQCSRFHMLIEFDDGKRSCRKRLAGHNERRRKPHYSSRFTRPHDLMESYKGENEFMVERDQRRRTLLMGGGESLCGGGGRYLQQGDNMWRDDNNNDNPSCYRPHFVHLHQHQEENNKQREEAAGGVMDQATTTTSTSIADLTEGTTSTTTSSVSFLSSDGISLPQNNNTTGSHISSYTISDITTDRPDNSGLFYHSHHSSSAMHHHQQQQQQQSSMEAAAGGSGVGFGVVDGGGGGDFMGAASKYCLPPHGLTVDLLQLSSHLQRVEQQRNSFMVKQDNDDFCCF